VVYRDANLEHAAASVTNLINGALLCALLALPLLAATAPEVAFFGVHPVSVVVLVLYVFSLKLASATNKAPGWTPVQTANTREDIPAEAQRSVRGAWRVWIHFLLFAAIVAVAGWVVGVSGIALVRHTGLSETLVGSLFTAVATSLPELVTAVAAVRQGALTLAVGGIIGGNTFDVLFLVFADVAYREGSIYHAISEQPLFIISLTLLLTAILLLGLIRRERSGVANIGFESVAVLVFYLAGLAILCAGDQRTADADPLPIPYRVPAVRSIQQPIKAPAGMVSQPKNARLNRLKTTAPMIPCSGFIGGSPAAAPVSQVPSIHAPRMNSHQQSRCESSPASAPVNRPVRQRVACRRSTSQRQSPKPVTKAAVLE